MLSSEGVQEELEENIQWTTDECNEHVWKRIPFWLVCRIQKDMLKFATLPPHGICAQVGLQQVTHAELLSLHNRSYPVQLQTMLKYVQLLSTSHRGESDGKIILGFGSNKDVPVISISTSFEHKY